MFKVPLCQTCIKMWLAWRTLILQGRSWWLIKKKKMSRNKETKQEDARYQYLQVSTGTCLMCSRLLQFFLFMPVFKALHFECFYRLWCKNPLFSPWKKYVTYISLFSVAFNIPESQASLCLLCIESLTKVTAFDKAVSKNINKVLVPTNHQSVSILKRWFHPFYHHLKCITILM